MMSCRLWEEMLLYLYNTCSMEMEDLEFEELSTAICYEAVSLRTQML
jgi:hypothetical protein